MFCDQSGQPPVRTASGVTPRASRVRTGLGLRPDLVTATGLPFFENFYAGGVRSVRGFRDNTLGPRESAVGQQLPGQPLGGAVKTVGSLEMYLPDAVRQSRPRAFRRSSTSATCSPTPSDFDASELRASAGISLLWRAPVGPISISYALPLRKEDDDEIERLQFTFGGAF